MNSLNLFLNPDESILSFPVQSKRGNIDEFPGESERGIEDDFLSFPNITERSIEVCCNDYHLLTCTEVKFNPENLSNDNRNRNMFKL